MSRSNALESLHALRLVRERFPYAHLLEQFDALLHATETAVVVDFRAISESASTSYASR